MIQAPELHFFVQQPCLQILDKGSYRHEQTLAYYNTVIITLKKFESIDTRVEVDRIMSELVKF
jgi:hypothetical protein